MPAACVWDNHATSLPACELSLVIPAFNETERLPMLMGALAARSDLSANSQVEIIVVDDGSSDATAQVAQDRMAGFARASVYSLQRNSGKGAALRAGVAASRGAQLLFMDADLATNLDCIAPLRKALDTHHIAVGSRALPDSIVHNGSRYRHWMGTVYNRLLRLATGITVSDSQCGFKALRGPVARLLFHVSIQDGFGQDAEILDMAATLGFRTAEIAVEWTNVTGSKVSPVRDSLATAREVRKHRQRSWQQVSIPTVSLDPVAEVQVRAVDPVLASVAGQIQVLVLHTDAAQAAAHRLGLTQHAVGSTRLDEADLGELLR